VAQQFGLALKMKKASEIEVADELRISAALTALANKLDSKDAQLVSAAARALNSQFFVVSSIGGLNFDLEDIKREIERDLRKYPDQAPKIELASSIQALDATCRALRGLVPVDTLELLLSALNEIIAGAALPAMFHPTDASGRRPDGPSISAVKAVLAGLMRANQDAGMSRKEAARWIVKYISPRVSVTRRSKRST
jgi:hypothetical protein